jgi:hypothetical protein
VAGGNAKDVAAAAAAGRGGATGAGGALHEPAHHAARRFDDGVVCYRALLWQMLQSAGKTFNFVGTRNGDPGCGVRVRPRQRGPRRLHRDRRAEVGGDRRAARRRRCERPVRVDARDLATWFDGKPADIVLMHFATNDVWNNKSPTEILSAYTTILGRLRGANPNVRVMVAQIISAAAVGLQRLHDARAEPERADPAGRRPTARRASPITVVDQFTGFNPRRARTPATACIPTRRIDEDRQEVVRRAVADVVISPTPRDLRLIRLMMWRAPLGADRHRRGRRRRCSC